MKDMDKKKPIPDSPGAPSASLASAGYVALFQLGSFYDAADVTRVYSAFAKAKEAIPKGFRCLGNLRNGVYAENEQKRQWLKITMYRIDET
jgi:hypothetical protein